MSVPHPLSDSWDAEKQHLVEVYDAAEDLRADTVEKLRTVLVQSGGTPQERSERESYNRLYTSQIRLVDESHVGLCFGRIDMVPEAAQLEVTRYIGRMGLLAPDVGSAPLLVDWRAPLAQPYYLATTLRPTGVWRRRTLHTIGQTLHDISDEFLTHGPTPEGYPEPCTKQAGVASESSLLRALNAPRSSTMTDIVATIQREQDEIIRCPHRGVVVVQGGPGTGKTAVALHRAAYLLYTHRSQLERAGVLIIGPNDTFLRYINRVLPSLGETGVVLMTLGDLFPGVSGRDDDTPSAQEIKGSTVMVNVITQAIRMWETLLDTPVTICVDGTPFTVTSAMVRRARTRARSSRRPHNRAQQVFHDRLVQEIVSGYAELMGTDPATPDLPRSLFSVTDTAELTEELLHSPEIHALVHEHWPALTAQDVIARLLTDAEAAAEATSGILPSGDLAHLLRDSAEPYTVADIALLDEAAEQLGALPRTLTDDTDEHRWQQMVEDAQDALDILKASASMEFEDESDNEILAAYDIIDARRLAQRHTQEDYLSTAQRAIADREWAYGHVIVDEAQELSPMAWRMVMRRSPNRWMTIVGDTAQTSNPAGVDNWADALSPYVEDRWRHFTLTVNYRTIEEIMHSTAEVLHHIDPHAVLPQSLRSSGRPVALVDRFGHSWYEAVSRCVEQAHQYDPGESRTCGVITSPEVFDELHNRPEDTALNATIAQVNQAKGLEFDYVIVVDPVGIVTASPQGLNDLFVAMTRATQALVVVHDGTVPACLSPLLSQQPPQPSH